MNIRQQHGFTLVEVLVALMIIALSLAALMTSISSTARASEYLRDKSLAQWMAMNRITEVRLNIQSFGVNNDKGELQFGNRRWRYDTRYFETDNTAIRRVVVRVWPATAKENAAPLAESASFLGTALSAPGTASNLNWSSSTAPFVAGNPSPNPAPAAPSNGINIPTQ